MSYYKYRRRILLTSLLLSVIFTVVMSGVIRLRVMCSGYNAELVLSEEIRAVSLNEEQKQRIFFVTNNDETGSRMIYDVNENELDKIVVENIYWYMKGMGEVCRVPSMFSCILPDDIYQTCYNAYYSLLSEVRYFPVADDVVGGETTPFDNSWGAGRTYGGDRKHEGTDLMASNNTRGYFPVVSMTDGVVEKVGWLELGGWRVGIRSSSGAYYYYAHMAEFAEGIEEGVSITAGTVIGTMGDSGYSEVEGTTGNFDVHLHMGMYYDIGGEEVSFNPYYILKAVEECKKEFVIN